MVLLSDFFRALPHAQPLHRVSGFMYGIHRRRLLKMLHGSRVAAMGTLKPTNFDGFFDCVCWKNEKGIVMARRPRFTQNVGIFSNLATGCGPRSLHKNV